MLSELDGAGRTARGRTGRGARDQARRGAGPLFVESTTTRDAPRLNVARDADGSCVFFDRDAGRLCAIHREAGADALPSACRHFPRKILRDLRGTFISLSHFCPTAAAMLLARDPLHLVEAHPPLRLSDPIEGLDATDALPPLVRPGVLCDLEGYSAWEQASVATFARADLCYQDALDLVAAATEDIRELESRHRDALRTGTRGVSRRASRSGRRPARAGPRDRDGPGAEPRAAALAHVKRFEETSCRNRPPSRPLASTSR